MSPTHSFFDYTITPGAIQQTSPASFCIHPGVIYFVSLSKFSFQRLFVLAVLEELQNPLIIVSVDHDDQQEHS